MVVAELLDVQSNVSVVKPQVAVIDEPLNLIKTLDARRLMPMNIGLTGVGREIAIRLVRLGFVRQRLEVIVEMLDSSEWLQEMRLGFLGLAGEWRDEPSVD